MIKAFKRIRKNALNSNRFSKYLMYALGEIILVVIGILIALALNNWNNNRRGLKSEIKYLHQIKFSLQENIRILEDNINRNDTLYTEGEELLLHLKSKKPLDTSTRTRLGIPNFDFSLQLNTGAFENLKNEGLSHISNDNLKIEIINIYDQELTYIQKTFAQEMENYISAVIHPFYSKNFELQYTQNNLIFEPNNYELLLQNPEMTNILSMTNELRSFAIGTYINASEKMNLLVAKIDVEIARLED